MFKCYYEALRQRLTQTKGAYEIWRNKYPHLRHPNMTPNTLSNRRRQAEKRALTQAEIRTIRASTEEETNTNTEEAETDAKTKIEEVETENTEEPTDEMMEMEGEPVVRLNYIKNIKLEERDSPKSILCVGIIANEWRS